MKMLTYMVSETLVLSFLRIFMYFLYLMPTSIIPYLL